MRTLAVLIVAAAAAPAPAQDKDKPTVTAIPTKDLKITHPKAGKATEPATIASAEELEKNPVVEASADELKKKVDFDKQKLLVFAWSGSGGDVLTASIGVGSDKKPIVYVEYLRGKTFDLKQHVRLLAVPKDVSVEVDGK